ncbi:MAG: ATP-binding cassette domain-containing protein [Desulfurococcales archaeon]|nr:ATP-binding cassette domain-containing protein [Desulfurococcales archaeon]
MEAFVLEGVWKYYGATAALQGVSLRMGGGLNVIVGPNGSGKTTIVKLLLGATRPSRGLVRTLGLDPAREGDRVTMLVGMGLEGISLPWWLTGYDVLKTLAKTRSLEWGLVREIAGVLGVDSYWGRSIRGYSMGMRKRLLLAAAFSAAREALVLDEPFTLLDARSRGAADSLILDYSRKLPVLVTTHVVTPSMLNAGFVAVIASGRIVASASVESLDYRDVVCEPAGEQEEFMADLVRAGRLEFMELYEGRVMASYSEPPRWDVIARHNCRPSLFRLLRYERLGGV